MYKLILVDDEQDVREGLLDLIDWKSLGYQIMDTAENGREALELVEKHIPDVVVTDIQMPFMNGLELSEWIREHNPATKIIILTGYEEFEYAQKAIRLGIDEYVLKPFSARELASILDKVKKQLDEEMSAKENVQLLTEHYRKNLPILQSLFLSSLVTRKLPQQEIREKCQHYDLDLHGGAYVVSVIRIDSHGSAGHIYSGADTKVATISLRDTKDIQLKLFAILNIVDEIMHHNPKDKVFIHHDEVVLLSVYGNVASDEMGNALTPTLNLLEEIRYSIERYLKLTVTIGVGSTISDIAGVYNSFQEAERALDYRMILGSNKVIWIGDVESQPFPAITFDETREKELIRCLKVGSDRELTDLIEELFAGLIDSGISYQDFHVYLLMMLTAVIKAAQDVHVDLDQLFDGGVVFLSQLSKFTNAEEAKAWFINMSMKLKNSIAYHRQSSYNLLVEEAKAYINKHYGEQDLSITKVCKHLHISTGYFSSIFKKETKMTFVNYLMNVRMEAAQNMLRLSDLKAFEIADQVGFADPNYFSFCFRKKFGISPKEYRGGAKTI
ncbi:putative response regulatory protein [compost metagenome]